MRHAVLWRELAWCVLLTVLGYALVYGSAVVWADAVEAEAAATAAACSVCSFAEPSVIEVQ